MVYQSFFQLYRANIIRQIFDIHLILLKYSETIMVAWGPLSGHRGPLHLHGLHSETMFVIN